jgi:hypothetical protein
MPDGPPAFVQSESLLLRKVQIPFMLVSANFSSH